MANTTIRLGGVPEHFNLPIHQAIEARAFDDYQIDLQWQTFKGGTGAMVRSLEAGEVDACILLTEGIVTAIANGLPAKIISGYVNTPLTWGIHTGFDNPLQHYSDIYNRRYAISRFGSGSHLMAIVDAHSKDKAIDPDQFVIIQNLDGALDSLSSLTSDVFYWEKFTTKPFVDQGILRRIGEFVTPWPCFVIAARNEVLDQMPNALIRMLRVIHTYTDRFMLDDSVVGQVSNRYQISMKDAERWYHGTEWAIHGWVSDKMLRSVVYNLVNAAILKSSFDTTDLVWKRERG